MRSNQDSASCGLSQLAPVEHGDLQHVAQAVDVAQIRIAQPLLVEGNQLVPALFAGEERGQEVDGLLVGRIIAQHASVRAHGRSRSPSF